jgi:hypothetical protein
MFLKLLKKLATEYKAGETYFGGDLEEDLAPSGKFGTMREAAESSALRTYVRALYDLGVLVALPAPAEGEVVVDAVLSGAILHTVTRHRIETLRACYGCGCDVEKDAVKLQCPSGSAPDTTTHVPIAIWTLGAFCPNCASVAGSEWRKP